MELNQRDPFCGLLYMAVSDREDESRVYIVYCKTVAVDSLWRQRLEDVFVMMCACLCVREWVWVRVRASACAMRARCLCILA